MRTKIPFDIQFGFPNRLVAAVQFRQTSAKMTEKVKITFCVRGVLALLFHKPDVLGSQRKRRRDVGVPL